MTAFGDWLFQIDRRRQEARMARERAARDRYGPYRALYYGEQPTRSAEEAAEELLFRHLDRDQRRSYSLRKGFEVKGAHNIYWVTKAGGVDAIKPRGSFCVYLRERILPSADRALAMKLYIEGDEEGFLREANFSDDATSLVKLRIDGTVDREARYGMFGNHLWEDALQLRLNALQGQYLPRFDTTAGTVTTSTLNFQTGGDTAIQTVTQGTITFYQAIETTTIGDVERTYIGNFTYDET